MRQFLISIDQVLNTVLGGWADETVSARAWRLRERSTRWKYTMLVINAIFFDSLHCAKSYTSELTRRQLPPEYR
jgi:hypothetical protein